MSLPLTSLPTAVGTNGADSLLIVQSGIAKLITVSLLQFAITGLDADLIALGAVSTTGVIERTGAGAFSTFTISSTGKTLVGGANATAMRGTLGLGTAATLNFAASGNAGASEVVRGNDSRLSNARTPTAHAHTLAEITDAGTAAALNVASSGDAASGEVVKGNDTRLTNARTPSNHASRHAAAGVDPITPADIGAAAASHTHPHTAITGLGTMATQSAASVAIAGGSVTATIVSNNATITGGSITGITDLAVADGGTGASNAADARTNLGLGTMATQAASSVAITGGSIAGITDLAIADGGTGASTAADARTNLGLGTMATQASGAVTITGGSITGITDLAIADGGTGASTAPAALANLGGESKEGQTTVTEGSPTEINAALNTPAYLLTLTNDRTITITGGSNGKRFRLLVRQDGTGGHAITWPTLLWAGGTPVVATATAGAEDLFEFNKIDGSWYASRLIADAS